MKSAIISIAVLTITSLAAACDDADSDATPATIAPVPTEFSPSPSLSPSPSAGPTPLPPYLLPAQTVAAGPSRYEQSAFGYSYEIPAGWFAHGNYTGYCAITTFEPGSLPPADFLPTGEYKIEIYVSESEGKDLESWLAERDEVLGITPDEIDQLEGIIVSGEPAITRRVADENIFLPGEKSMSREYWFASGAHIFVIWGEAGQSEAESALDTIVASFQLDS